jgi:hypothetical protein
MLGKEMTADGTDFTDEAQVRLFKNSGLGGVALFVFNAEAQRRKGAERKGREGNVRVNG